jgi:hypothetical protein
MFPEETLHCVEWAKDLFGNWFTLKPQSFNKFFDDEQKDFNDIQVQQIAKKVKKMSQKRPQNFSECLEKARSKFNSIFVNQILQLLHTYPHDMVTKDNRPFWSLPKRTPKQIDFNPENPLHASFIASYACLYATLYKIKISEALLDEAKDPRSKQSKYNMAKFVVNMEVKAFISNDQKAQSIQMEVNKQQLGAHGGQQGGEPGGSSVGEAVENEVDVGEL